MWFDRLAVLGAAVIEAVGAVLFWRALRLSQRPEGRRAAWLALGHNMLVWLGFIVGTEFFVAYGSESPFRELLMIGMLMAAVYAVVPDDAGATGPAPAVTLGQRGVCTVDRLHLALIDEQPWCPISGIPLPAAGRHVPPPAESRPGPDVLSSASSGRDRRERGAAP